MTWTDYHRQVWADLNPLEEPASGRRLDVGGFVFADPPEVLWRNIGSGYIRTAWDHLTQVLAQHHIVVADLRWGAMHQGETNVAGVSHSDPCRFIGWTSQSMADEHDHPRWSAMNESLVHQNPALRCAFTWRSLQWRIAPDDLDLGLQLFEALAIDETTDWSPDHILSVPRDPHEPWIRAAMAIRDASQEALNNTLASAQASYSPLGYRIVSRGFEGYSAECNLGLRFPQF